MQGGLTLLGAVPRSSLSLDSRPCYLLHGSALLDQRLWRWKLRKTIFGVFAYSSSKIDDRPCQWLHGSCPLNGRRRFLALASLNAFACSSPGIDDRLCCLSEGSALLDAWYWREGHGEVAQLCSMPFRDHFQELILGHVIGYTNQVPRSTGIRERLL